MTSQLMDEPRTSNQVICLLCGQSKWSDYLLDVNDYLTGESFDIICCDNCGMIVTRPCPSEAEIGKYYPPRYRGNRHGFTGHMRVVLRRKAIERQFPPGFRGRLLDVGCGNGDFVMHMHSRGWKVSATEMDLATVDRLRAIGIDAKLPSDAEQNGFDEKFDAVTCWHVMEHVQHPEDVSRWVKTQLKPDGVFQSTVPNIDCLQEKIFKRHWLHLDVPRHRYHFTKKTFRKLLQDTGYTITGQNVFAIEYDWFGVVQGVANVACRQQNVLFDMLTRPEGAPRLKAPPLDKLISILLAPFAASLSILPLLIAAAADDGATLTLTCKPQSGSGWQLQLPPLN